MSQLEAAMVIVSDIHLNRPEDSRGRGLLSLLKDVEMGQVDHLVLLGDIFDFCLGSHCFFQKKFEPIGDALSRISAKGTRVSFLEGNHEFKLASLPWKGVHIIPSGTEHFTLADGRTVQAAHGDMIYSHRRYKAFRWLVKSRFVTFVASFLPGPWMDKLATTGSEVSRSADQYRTIRHEPILSAVNQWLETGGAQFGIFGHFHVPYAEPRRDGKAGRVLSVDCWDKPNALVFKKEGIFRLWQEGERWGRWEPATAVVQRG